MAIVAVALGCSNDTGPGSHSVPFRVLAGGAVSDTVQARLTSALIVEIHDSAGGSGAGRVVRFESLPPDDSARKTETAVLVTNLTSNTYSTFLSSAADSTGQAKALVALGTVAGTARLRVSVPEFGLIDTVLYTVLPGAATKLTIGNRDTTVQPGATYSIRASASDRLNNLVPAEPLTYTPGAGIASVTPSGQVTVGNSIVRSKIAVTWKTGSDTARVTVLSRLALVGVRQSANRIVVLANTDGTGYTELATSQDQSLSPSSVKTTGNVVYYTGNPGGNAAIWIVSPGGTAHTLLPASLNLVTAQWPRLSPDGQWVYFVGWHSGQTPSVWRIRPDGTGADSLGLSTSFSVFATPGPSPDGRFVAVVDANGLRVIDVTSKTFQIVHTSVSCQQPRYSPDGARIACVSGGLVTVMNADGSNLRQLASGFEDLSGADWSPDGAWLIAHGNGYQLISVADGTMLNLSSFASSYIQLSFVR